MAADESEEKKGFKVEDRRRFSEDGEARPGVDEAEPSQQDAPSEDQERSPEEPPQSGKQAIEITFASFIIGLSTQALALLGEIPHPEEGATKVDLDGARHIIDILGLLQEKTRGNLDSSEETLLENALYDLRMRYVERAR
jgi:hypothetical protein